MSFGRPDLLWLTAFFPVLAALALWRFAVRRRRVARLLGATELLARLGAGELERFPWTRAALILGATALLGLAAAGPQWGRGDATGPTRAANLVVALDVSKSMLARDVEPSRLERERIFTRQLIRQLEGDRIGLVAFSGRGYILSPLTADRGALELYLDALEPSIVSQGGSSLASALEQAVVLAAGRDERSRRGGRAVVLVSDGEALEERDEVLDAADRARRAGVAVFTVGIGTAQGATVPEVDPETGAVVGEKRGPDGEIVVSRLDADLLRTVAQKTGGRYVQLGTSGATSRLMAGLRDLERTRSSQASGSQAGERYAWFIALALILLAVDLVFLDRPKAPALERSA